MKPVHQIPAVITYEDGSVTWGAMRLLPPKLGACSVCAHDHEPEQPHNPQTLYYQVVFNGMIGRPPTWADAMAHCSEATRAMWRTELERIGHWSEPPANEKPVAHHGVEDEKR